MADTLYTAGGLLLLTALLFAFLIPGKSAQNSDDEVAAKPDKPSPENADVQLAATLPAVEAATLPAVEAAHRSQT